MILALLFTLDAAETIFVPQNTFLFKAKQDTDTLSKAWEIEAIAQQDFYGEVIKKEKVFLSQEKASGFYVDSYHLKIPGTGVLQYFPEVNFKKEKNGNIIPCVDKIDSLMFLGIFFIIIGLAALAGYFRLKSEKKKYLLPAALLFFFWGYACWYIGYVSDSFITPSDEIYYFNIAKKILDWDFTSIQYRYLIGFPLFCIPFILLSSAQNYMDFICLYMNFQTFILIPGLFLLLYRFFIKKMGIPRNQSFCILLLWLILMVFYLPIKSLIGKIQYIPENYLSNAVFLTLENNFYFSFIRFHWLGRNALSDYAAFFLFIILAYAAMKKSQSLLRLFILSMGFGFLCLVRINNILFAPFLAFVFYDSFSGLWKNKRNYLYALLCGIAGLMTVFIWQLLLNKIQFGSPFVGPYSLHENGPDRGFGWDVIPYGFRFLWQTNFVYMTLGISSLFFIPERKNRVLLTLWIFPFLLFFIGYPGVFNNPIRFIFALYPPLLAAIVMNPVWQAAWPVRIKAALVVFCSCLLCKSNIFYIRFQPWNLGMFGISNNVFIIIQGMICLFCCAVIFSMRKELRTDYANTIRHFRFLILFTAVFFFGSVCPYIAGILVAAAVVYGLRDTWMVIRQIGEESVTHSPSDS